MGEPVINSAVTFPRDAQKKKKKTFNYGKQHFSGFIIFRIIRINLLRSGDTAQSCENMSAGGNAVLHLGVREWVCGARQATLTLSIALKVGPQTPFQNLVVEKTPGAILTLCLAGCIPELIIKVFKRNENKHRILAVHAKTQFCKEQCNHFTVTESVSQALALANLIPICLTENVVESTKIRTYQSL